MKKNRFGENKLDNKMIEKASIGELENILTKTNMIDSFITTNDKTPSWDGDVILYKSKDLSKNNIDSIFRFQVKGTQVENFSSKYIKYPIDTVDMNNYYNDGGCIYVVGEVIETEESRCTKLFYICLTPMIINSYLKGKENQGAISVKLNSFPVGKQNIVAMLKKFSLDKNNQPKNLISEQSRDIAEFKKFNISPVTYDEESIFKNTIGKEFYLYAKENNIILPLNIITIDSVAYTDSLEISSGGKVFFKNVLKTVSNDDIVFKFGKSIMLRLHNKELTLKFNIDSPDLHTIEFLIACFENNSIVINLMPELSWSNINSDISIDYLYEIRNYFLCIKDLESYFNINIDFKIKNSNIKTLKKLSAVRDSLLMGYKKNNKIISKVIKVLYKIENVTFEILEIVYEDGTEDHIDYFSYALSDNFGVHYNPNNIETSQLSPYAISDYSEFLAANLNCEIVLDSLKKYSLTNENHAYINKTLLEILLAYDISQDKKLLFLSKELIAFIRSKNLFDEIDFINECQILKRQSGELDDLKFEKLLDLKRSDNLMICCSCNILLDSFTEFKRSFKKLSSEEKEEFRNFPIYNLLPEEYRE